MLIGFPVLVAVGAHRSRLWASILRFAVLGVHLHAVYILHWPVRQIVHAGVWKATGRDVADRALERFLPFSPDSSRFLPLAIDRYYDAPARRWLMNIADPGPEATTTPLPRPAARPGALAAGHGGAEVATGQRVGTTRIDAPARRSQRRPQRTGPILVTAGGSRTPSRDLTTGLRSFRAAWRRPQIRRDQSDRRSRRRWSSSYR